MCQFTIPTGIELELKTGECGVVSIRVHLLGSGTPRAKSKAAISHAQFSRNSQKLSRPMRNRCGFMCFSAPPELRCRVHRGVCSVRTSFCLLEVEGTIPFVQALEKHEGGACEAAVEALSSLVYDEHLENSIKAIAEADRKKAVVRLLTVGFTQVQDRAVWILERVFRNEGYKIEYGNAALMPLVDLTQRGTSTTRPLAAKIVANLNVLHDQLSYF